MNRGSSMILLAMLGAGVFLSGLELMITAVALPSIVADLADWTQLRHASWIVNGYLLVFVIAMPLAGRATDVWGARRLFLAALVAFTIGSLLAGRAQTLDELIVARLIQGLGGGIIVPVATAAASHLFEGYGRARALGVIGGLTFLGMAAGPFVGAAILSSIYAETALAIRGVTAGVLVDVLAPAWRWVFYVNVPIGIVALVVAWAASAGWETPRTQSGLDLPGAIVFSAALAALLGGLTFLDDQLLARFLDPSYTSAVLLGVAAVLTAVSVAGGLWRRDPFLNLRLFRSGTFSSAALVSLLTGYALATAIVGGAVFVDRVLYGGPDQQRLALGALAGATAVGALASGLIARFVSLRVLTVGGLLLSAFALWRMSGWSPVTPINEVALALAGFGLGFGLTVTPRSTAAVEAVGRRYFGMASATVTVARMIGMAVGLAILVAYGSTTIERLTNEVYATPDAYRQFVPESLRDRSFKDGLVVDALETWAAGEAARIMVGLFVVAGALTLVALVPALALGTRPEAREGASSMDGPPVRARGGPDGEEPERIFSV